MQIADFVTQNFGGHIGQSSPRADGPVKVQGAARYAAERHPENMLYGFPVPTITGGGRITAIRTQAAEAVPGVVTVITRSNAPDQAAASTADGVIERIMGPQPNLTSTEIQFHGEFVALVLAETYEAARDAAALVTIEVEGANPGPDFEHAQATAYTPKALVTGDPADTASGDVDATFAAAPVQLDATYDTPFEHHNAMEPHAAVAWWEDGKLTIQDTNQGVSIAATALAATFKLQPDQVQVISHFVGGGFGGKFGAMPHSVLAAIGAKVSGRPVKVVLTRQQVFTGHGHRSRTRQRIRLAAERDGTLVAISHDTMAQTSLHGDFIEQAGVMSRIMYAAPNRGTTHRVARLHTPTPSFMRAPGEAPGAFALECAMDELAVKLGMDPIALRLKNEPAADPNSGLPWSSRSFRACLEQGAAHFGWSQRSPKPGTHQDGRWLVGMGVAGATYPSSTLPASARITLHPDATALVEIAAADVGTGTYTILRQVAAEALGLEQDAIEVRIGDSSLPMAFGAAGSTGAASFGSAVTGAALTLRMKLTDLARSDDASPLRGLNSDAIEFRSGRMQDTEGRGEPLAALLARAAPEGIGADHSHAPDSEKKFSMHAFGAQFAEVGVDMDTGEVRTRRMLGAFGVGRILNARTAESQMHGGITMGIGQALMEETIHDARWGQWVNRDLGEYHVPTNADVPHIESLFVEERDDQVNALGIKGIGEIGIVGVAAAIANAVYNATGVRIRDLPITLDKVLAGLDAAA